MLRVIYIQFTYEIGSYKKKFTKNQPKHHDSVTPFSCANTSLPSAGLDWGWLVKVGASHQLEGRWEMFPIRKQLELIISNNDQEKLNLFSGTCCLC